MKRLFPLLVVLLLSISTVHALKISARKTLKFEPGLEYNGKVCVFPASIKRVQLTPTGELKQYITVEKRILNLSSGPKCIPYTVKLPQSFEKPGLHKGGIEALEKPKQRGNAQIVARVSITHQIWVRVPYPGKYLKSSVEAANAEAGKPVSLKINIKSKGNETIKEANGQVEIWRLTKQEKQVGTVPVRIQDIKSQTKRTVKARWNSTGNDVGRYEARLTLAYGNRTTTATDRFKLGSLEVRMINYTRQAKKGGIVPFYVTAESFWSEPVKNVKATVSIPTKKQDVTFETLTKTIQPWQTTRLKGYLDTNKLKAGTYDATITLQYGEQSKQYKRQISIRSPQSGFSITTSQALLFTTIALALLVLVLAAYVFKKSSE